MKSLYTLLLLIGPTMAGAQNWQCLQSGVKHYFVSNDQYVRGIRVDSVRTAGASTFYYPHHTPRGFYLTNPNLDSTGGSWLGKRVAQRNDSFVFDNIWNDSVIIKTQANAGDSWTFYADTTPRYYNATLTGKDTMTVSGGVDSIKKILITAHSPSGIVTTDPADSFQVILSKNHGFVQVFDLYTFPYHRPDLAYAPGIDFYLDAVVMGSTPNKHNSIFLLTDIYNPTQMGLNVWSAGDVFEYKSLNQGLPCALIYPQSYQYEFDSIIAATTYPDRVEYSCVGWLATQDCFTSPYPDILYDTTGTHYVHIFYNSDNVIDTSLMPEEMNHPYFIYYDTSDPGYCMPGIAYRLYGKPLLGAVYPTFSESSGPFFEYKVNLGLVRTSLEFPPGIMREDMTLLGYSRSGVGCGSYVFPPLVTSVNDTKMSKNDFSFSPNPASDELTLQTELAQPYTVSLINMIGQKVKTYSCNQPRTTISTRDLPAGLYSICIISANGYLSNYKVEIVH